MGAKSRFGLTSASVSRMLTPWFATTAVAVAALVSAGEPAGAMETPKDSGKPTNETALPEGQQAAPSQTVHDFNISAGTISDVATALQKATGIIFVAPPDTVGGLASPGVKGVLTVEEALKAVLTKTGVSAKFVSPERVVLELHGADESVTVTADVLPSPKYTAPLLDLPQTLTVIPEEVIQYTGSTSLVEALRTVPGITFGAGEGGNPIGDRPFIRGADSQSSTYVDGMRDIGSQSREVFNLESVEVSKGPSGSFGGRGTSGGSLNLNNKQARRQNFVAGSFSPGSAGFLRGTVDGNVKINDFMSGRLNGLWNNNDVAGRDGVHMERWGIAPTVALGLGKPTRAYVSYYHLIGNDMPDPGIPYNNPTFNARTDGRPRILQAGDGSPITLPNRGTFYGLLDRDKNRQTVKTGTGRVERNLFGERSVIRNTFRYGRSSQDYLVTQPDDSQGNLYYGLIWRRTNQRVSSVYSAINQTDLSGQFETGSLKHTYATGGEFSQERGNNDTYTITTNPVTNNRCLAGTGAASAYNCTDLYNPNRNDPWTGSIVRAYNPTNSKTATKSAYAFDTINILPKLQATLGLRYDNYNSRFTSTSAAANVAICGTLRCTFKRTDNLVNYQVGVVYKPLRIGSVYGSVSTAATPAGNALAQGSDPNALSNVINSTLAPEKTRSVEVGTKWEAFKGKALTNAAWFESDVNNARITQADGTIAMAGVKRVRGVELGITGQITKKWQMFTGYTYMSAILVSAGGAGAANGLTNGTSFPNTPKNSFSLTSYYSITRNIMAGGGVYTVSKVWGNQSTNKWVPGYARVDLFGSYKINKHLNLQVNVQNVGDKLYYDRAYTTHYANMAPGRSGRIGFNVNY